MAESAGTRIVRRQAKGAVRKVEGDICVVGAGAAGASAAIEAARLGRKVVLIDGMPALGGQAVNSIIGTFCGLFSNGTHGYQFTHGIADDILETLGKNSEQLYYRNGPLTTVVYYDEVALGRWIERTVRELGIQVIVGAVVREVDVEGRRIKKLHLATRYGDVEVEATGFVDASGDAALVYQAGFACREPTSPIYGTQMVILEQIDEAKLPTREEIPARMREKGDKYGLVRREGSRLRHSRPRRCGDEHDACGNAAGSDRGLDQGHRRQGPGRSCGGVPSRRVSRMLRPMRGSAPMASPVSARPAGSSAASSSPSMTCGRARSFRMRLHARPGRSSCMITAAAITGTPSTRTMCITSRYPA